MSEGPGNSRLQALRAAWADLEDWEVRLERVPARASDFKRRYGESEDTEALAVFLAACAEARSLLRELGHPAAVAAAREREPEHLLGLEPPRRTVDRVLWLVAQVEHTAGAIHSTLGGLDKLLLPTAGTQEQRAESLRALLAGGNGLAAIAERVAERSRATRAAAAATQARLLNIVAALAGSTVPGDAHGAIARLGTQGRVRPTAGQTGEIARKRALIADLDGFFLAAHRVAVSSNAVQDALVPVETELVRVADRMRLMCNIADAKQLSDAHWVGGALGLPEQRERIARLREEASLLLRHALPATKTGPPRPDGERSWNLR